MSDSLSIKFDTSRLNAVLDRLGTGIEDLVRPAAQAGAQVFYDEMLLRVPVAEKGHTTKGGREIPPGTLKNSIYQVYSKDNSGSGRATYHITWNRAKASHGHLIEYGHWTKTVGKYGPLQRKWVPAHPFQRPTYDAVHEKAVEAARAKMADGIRKLIAGSST